MQKLAIRNKELRNEVKTLDLTRESGSKRLKTINTELDKNNAFVKENADSMLKQKMNIGNYQSALQGVPGPLGMVTRGIQGMTAMAKAFIATPLGLILGLLAGAVKLISDAVKTNQPLMDRFKVTGDGIRARYAVLTDTINDFIDALTTLRTGGWEKLLELSAGIILGTGKIADEMKRESEEAKELTRAEIALEEQEIKDIARKSELRKAIEEKRLESKEESITEKERLGLIDEAIALEEELLEIELVAARERARINQERVEQADSTREELKENAEIQAQLVELETASLKKRRTLASERLSVARKVAKEEEAIAEQQALIAAKALDNEVELVLMQSQQIDAIKTDELVKAQNQADQLVEITRVKTDEQIKLEQLVRDAKLDIAQSYLSGIANLFGKETAVAKAAAVAETAINTYRGAQSAFTALAGIPIVGPGLGIAAAAAAGLQGAANVRKILQIKSGLPGDSGSSGSAPSAASTGGFPTPSRSSAAYTDGGLTTRAIIDITQKAVKSGVKEAMEESPPRTILVVEDVTTKQGEQDVRMKTITV